MEAKYRVDPGQQGMKDSRKWSAGADITYLMNPNTSFMVGYMYEWGSQFSSASTAPLAATGLPNPCVGSPDSDQRHDHRAYVHSRGALWRAIPEKLDTELRYTASHGTG